ncbi:CIS tube protein [Shewanella surugensis]|uniref:Contractile injection system tube protein N-terminal domain-containing protein n=1 Tax=Shewanella surugensis TaxID=212020 RepID=A0ABT0L686_9GAMM|nr:hypothetical protein [Shewanella surugensis]MCL1123202.1 hypothetical protein [Shewanella surugensis]
MSIFSDPTRAFVPVIKVTGYEDKGQTKKKSSVTLPYDKESLDVSFETCVVSEKSNKGEGDSYFSQSKPSSLKVTFVLDDTTFSNPLAYVMANNLIPFSVDKTINKLKELCHTVDNKLQHPPYVSIKSMGMPLMDSASGVFHGLLTEMKVKNELVDSLGNRVKAKVVCTFKHSGLLTEGNDSGGVGTQMLAAVDGLSLVAMAMANFGTIASVATLAAVNGLNSLRKVDAGDIVEVPGKLAEAAEKVKAQGEELIDKAEDIAKEEKDKALDVLEAGYQKSKEAAVGVINNG